MEEDSKTCKCGDKRCIGFILLHEKELNDIEQIKKSVNERYGDATFELKSSPSSGEIFTKFYDLHIFNNH